jgi:uncharacterized repeat protein (TIGR04076 family)
MLYTNSGFENSALNLLHGLLPTRPFTSTNMSKDSDDTFELYDLRVEVIVPPGDRRRILCGANEGDYFELKGEVISLPDGKGFSMYSLGEGWCDVIMPFRVVTKLSKAAALPLLAAKQRCREKKDWMWTDEFIACPDPNCPTKLKIIRTGIRSFSHGETTIVPLEVNA